MNLLLSFLSSLLLLLTVTDNKAHAIELQPRRASNCAFLTNKIYCFGGYITGYDGNDTISSLDIYQNKGNPVQNLNSQWEAVVANNPNYVDIGMRVFPQATALPDGDRFLIQGGYSYTSRVNVDQTIAYNAKTNSWELLANYFDANNGGNRQIYYGTAAYIPSLSGVGFYGGYQQHVVSGSNYVTPDGQSISGLTFNNSDGYINSYAGFYYFTLYNVNSNTWSVPSQFSVPFDFHISPSVVFNPQSNKLFYLGGSFFNTTSNSLFNSYLNYAMSFNTNSGQWLFETIAGNPPSLRKLHTTTMLANGQDVLLYGGTKDGTTAVMDYCYTLNLPSMTWTPQNLVAPVGTSGPRSHHSAVLINQTSLFILFGLDKDAKPRNDLLILDVRDVKNITFATNFPFDNDNKSSNSSNANANGNGNTKNNESAGLGTGAIAGIAVGAVAAVALLILAFICLFKRRKNNNNGHTKSSSSVNYEKHKNENENEILEVDWDKIDNQYKEINLPRQSFNQQYDNHGHHVEEFHSGGGSTSVPTGNSVNSSPTHVNASTISYDQQQRTSAVSPNFSYNSDSKPHSNFSEGLPSSGTTAVSPDIAMPPIMMNIVKPDGGGK